MAHAASVDLTHETSSPPVRSDLSAVMGILAALGISAGFWIALGCAIRAAVG